MRGAPGGELALLGELLRDDALHRAHDERVLQLLLELGDARVRRVPPGPRRVLLLRAEAGLEPAQPLLRGVLAGPRHVAPRAGVVARLRGAGAGGEEALHAVEVPLRAGEVGLRAGDLGPRLPHVLDARAGQAEPELGLGQGAIGAGGVEGEAGVGRVDPGQLLAGGDRVPSSTARLSMVPATLVDTRTSVAST